MSHMSVLTKAVAASAAAAAASTAYFGPGLLDYFRPNLQMFRHSFAGSGGGRSGAPGDALVDLPVPPWTCEHHHAYTTQLVSLDPLLVYIENFGTRFLFVNSYEAAVELFEKRGNIYSSRPTVPMIDLCEFHDFLTRESFSDEAV